MFSMTTYFVLIFLSLMIEKWNEVSGSDFLPMLLAFGFVILLFGSLAIFSFYLLRFESFNYTHYPMRFNRKTQMVHVFIPWEKGRYFSMPWKDAFFCHTSKGHDSEFAILGHQLSENKQTVLDSFLFAHSCSWDSPYRFTQWEFVRQYMEGDDKKVGDLAGLVFEVMDVANRRETPYASLRRMYLNFGAGQGLIPTLFALAFSPFIIGFVIGRQFAVRTSKIPRWSAEIEATCHFPPNDPNLRDGKHLSDRREIPIPDVSRYVRK